MKILLFHADYLYYKTLKKALKKPPDPPGEAKFDSCVVAFVSVEADDSKDTAKLAAESIIEYARDMVKEESIVIYPYAHLSSNLAKPPKAHGILTHLEKEISSKWNGKIHRVPFGWYKKLEISVKGHPLSELSRTIKAKQPLIHCNNKPAYTLRDAIEEGCIPEWIVNDVNNMIRESKLASEKIQAFNMDKCRIWEHYIMQERFLRKIEKIKGKKITVKEVDDATFPETILSAITSEAIDEGYYAGSCPLDSYIVVSCENHQNLLEALYDEFTQDKIEKYEISQGLYIYGYRTRAGKLVPIGGSRGNLLVLGSLRNLVKIMILEESMKAEKEGITPMLPIWLAPITIALIPVKEKHIEYAELVSADLARHGVNVMLLSPEQSIGTRIRQAAKTWTPYTAVLGDREQQTGSITVRRRWETGKQEVLTVSALIEEITGTLAYHGVLARILRY